MPIRDQYPGGVIEKQWARIVTVDTRTRRIDAQLKDHGVVQIALWDIPGGFRWPIEGERWLIVRENGIWFLRAPAQSDDEDAPKIEDLQPGDTQLGVPGTKVYIFGITELNDAHVSGDFDVDGDLNVDGNAVVDGNLGVGGLTTLDDLTVGGTANVTGPLNVDGPVDFDGALDVAGNTHVGGNLTLGGTMPLTDVSGTGELLAGEIPVWDGSGWVSASASSLATPPHEATITGDGATILFTITHNRGTRRVNVVVQESASPWEYVLARVRAATTNTVTIEINPAPAVGVQYAVTVFGGQNTINPAAHATSHNPGGSDPLVGFLRETGEHVRVTRTTNFAVPNAAYTPVEFNVEEYDLTGDGLNNQHDNATNNTRLTCRRTGVYMIVAGGVFTANANGANRVGAIRKNGSGVFLADGGSSPSSNRAEAHAIVKLTVGNYVEFLAFQDSGVGSELLATGGNHQPYFAMSRIGNA